MNYALLFSLIILVILTIAANKGEVFSPSIMLLGGFIICTIVLVAEQRNWEYVISSTTIWLIISSCLSFILGDVLGAKTKIITKDRNFVDNGVGYRFDRYFLVTNNMLIVIGAIIFTMVVLILQMRYFLRISALVGNNGGLAGAFSVGASIRSFVTHDSLDRSVIETLITKAALPVAYVSYFLFYNNKITGKKVRFNQLLLLPTILYVISELFTTNRIGIINCGIYILICSMCVIQSKRSWGKQSANRKFIKITLLTIILVFIVFRVSGYATQRGLARTMFDQISDYTGASIVAFDIKVRANTFNIMDASTLFNGLLRITNRVGLTNIIFMESNMGFSYWHNGATNIYTSICAYLSSIGYLGNYLTFFFMGLIYRKGFNKIRKGGRPSDIVLFSWLMFAPTLSCIAERFYTQIFVVNVLIQVVEVKLLMNWILKKRMIFRYN